MPPSTGSGRQGQNKGRGPSRARGPALWLFGGSGLAEEAVEVGAAHGARPLAHAPAVGLDDPALGLALLLALHAVEVALVGLASLYGLSHYVGLLVVAAAHAATDSFHPRPG